MLIPTLALTLISVSDSAIGRCSAAWMSTAARVATSTAGRRRRSRRAGRRAARGTRRRSGGRRRPGRGRRPEPGRHLDQQVVADDVAEAVVDELEAVEVDEADGDVRAVAIGAAEGDLEMLAEEHPVREPGQRVVVGEERELLLRRLRAVMSQMTPSRNATSPCSSRMPCPRSYTQRIDPSRCGCGTRARTARAGRARWPTTSSTRCAIIGVDDAREGPDVVLDELAAG